jgi:hypothetical protein
MNIQTYDQEKWGAMITLLSLDVVSPFYEYLGLNIDNVEEFKTSLRKDIIENREEYVKNPNIIPDLKKRNMKNLNLIDGNSLGIMLENWFQNSFVWNPADLGIYGKWKILFSISIRMDERWKSLDLPKTISEQARKKYEKDVTDKTELHALADQIDEQPHTKWDIEMYSLHGFDDYNNDPYNSVLFIIGYKRIKAYLNWLVSVFNDIELKQFLKAANHLQASIPALKPFENLYIPEEIKGAKNS